MKLEPASQIKEMPKQHTHVWNDDNDKICMHNVNCTPCKMWRRALSQRANQLFRQTAFVHHARTLSHAKKTCRAVVSRSLCTHFPCRNTFLKYAFNGVDFGFFFSRHHKFLMSSRFPVLYVLCVPFAHNLIQTKKSNFHDSKSNRAATFHNVTYWMLLLLLHNNF